MSLPESLDKLVQDVVREWNLAEGAIKLAEQVNGEIVNPAIYELRYAGRRLIEALAADNENAASDLLKDAHFDCCRARHDAVDACTSKMAADLDIAVDKLGADVVLESFPDLPKLILDLGDVRDKIAQSRENREDRDLIYSAIQGSELSEMVETFRRFRASEPLMKKAAAKRRQDGIRNNIFGWGGLAIAAITLLLSCVPNLTTDPVSDEVAQQVSDRADADSSE